MQKKSDIGMTCSDEKGRGAGLLQTYFKDMKLLVMKYRILLTVILLYLLLTVIFTYPVAFSTDSVPGGGDAYFYIWDLWWFKYAISHFITPFWTPFLFQPTGLNLAFSTITPFNGLISVPLQYFFGLVYTYNLLWLSSFIIAGYGSFCLVRYLTNDNWASFISGLIFMFCPYHFAHGLGHLSLISYGWIPLYILFLLKTITDPSVKNGVIAAVFLIFIGLNDYTYLFFTLSFTAILLMFFLITERSLIINKKTLSYITLILFLFSFGFILFEFPMIYELITSSSNYQGFSGYATFSSDLMGFIVPSTLHPLFGNIVSPIYKNFTGNVAENTIFAGFTVLFLAIMALLKYKKREIQFWLVATIIFIILSLGPILHFNGIVTAMVEGMTVVIPLPYALIMKLPVISMARAPSRWDIMVMLSLSVLAGYGANVIFKKVEKKTFGKISLSPVLSVLFIALILFEFLSVPVPMGKVNIPDFYHSISSDNESYSIYEIPDFNHHLSFPEYMMYQTIHEKPMLSGYTHIPDSATKFTENTPFIKNLYLMNSNPEIINTDGDIFAQNNTEIGQSVLSYYNVRYVILHENLLNREQLDYSRSLLDYSLGKLPTEHEKDFLLVYKVDKSPLRSFLVIGENWYDLQNDSGTLKRWMSNDGTIIYYSDNNYNRTLTFEIQSFTKIRTMELFVNNDKKYSQQVPPNMSKITMPIFLDKGENIIKFHSLESPERPSTTGGNPEDARLFSMAIQNLSVY